MHAQSSTHRESNMAEPTTTGVAGIFGGKAIWTGAAALGATFVSGVIGAAIIAAFDPPTTRRMLFLQALVAGIASIFFGPLAMIVIDYYADFIDLHESPFYVVIAASAPVMMLIGALSWGAFGALAKFRQLLRDRAADEAAKRLGL